MEQKHEQQSSQTMNAKPNNYAAHPTPAKDTDVTLTPETMIFLEERMAAAVKSGIESAMTEETAQAFWGAGVHVLQKSASEQTGRFVIGSVGVLARKALLFLLLGSIVYNVGGWTGLAKLWHSIWGAS